MDRLAQELVDAVVEEVRLQSPATLFALSCVARRFRVPSQRRIFRTLRLRLRNLWDVSDSPLLLQYVRDLRIHLDFVDTNVHHPLAKAFRLLGRVTHLSIVAIWDDRSWDWATLPKYFQEALVSLFTLPTLQGFVLHRCTGVPASLIRHAVETYTDVAFLDIGEITSDAMQFPPTARVAGSRYRLLDHLIVDYSSVTIRDSHALLWNTLATSAIRLGHLEIPFKGSERIGFTDEVRLDLLIEFFEKHSETMQQLTLPYNPLDRYNVFGLSAFPTASLVTFPVTELPRLRRLNLKFTMWKLDLPDSLTRLLPHLPVRTPSLETLNIAIDAAHERSPKLLDGHNRPELDHALTHLPRLREAHFCVCCDDATEFDDCIRDSLPLANEAGLLSFSRRQKPSK
ncbi:hypothetical protein DFH06DRAFT_758923 [Mycena polygramma]|nr:hypothetical protein DFH06DRAFT_758923 [Mycena polygramma]